MRMVTVDWIRRWPRTRCPATSGGAFSRTPRARSVLDLRGIENAGPAGVWLQFKVEDQPGNRQGVGTRVTVVGAEGAKA